MKRLFIAFIFTLFAHASFAANVNIDGLPAASSVAGTDLYECEQGGTNRRCTPAQMAAYIYGLMSGDATAAGTGAITFATVNSNVGSFGSTTNCVSLTVNAKGLITAASAATCAPAVGSVTGLGTGVATFLATPSSANLAAAITNETGSGAVVFGTAPTISSLNATTAMTLAFLTGSTQCLQVNTSGVVSGTGAGCGGGGGSGTVTSVSAGCGSSTGGSAITTTGTITASITARTQTTTSDTIVAGDCGNVVYENNAGTIAVSIAQAGTTGFAAGTFFQVCTIGAGAAVVTPTTSTIGGAANLTIPGGSAAGPVCYSFQSDGTNYNIIDSPTRNASLLSSGTVAAARLPFGTNVGTAAANTLSSAGGLTSTIASGTSALGTSAIASGACATAVTTTATNTATTDVVLAGFNGDPTAVTGYIPATAGMLTIIAYPTANNVNFKVCNNTSSSVTPGAITLNWRVVR